MTASPLPWQADKPYNQLPPLPPTAELETRAAVSYTHLTLPTILLV